MNSIFLPNLGSEDLREHILRYAWDCVPFSNCLDKQLVALLVKDRQIIGRGWNLCAPPPYNYGDKLSVCHRKDTHRTDKGIAIGAGREKCRGFHAEPSSCLSSTSRGITPEDYA
ncbi:MAG: hypothetical protein Q7K28_00480, partial [Candidatus Wildermuthbacteria bacterium]|nr:hypothetical protein [Candidatus Wildermuthbacteria bacterium]